MANLLLIKFLEELEDCYGSERTLREIVEEMRDEYFGKEDK